jgi:signal transduction histidine kinase
VILAASAAAAVLVHLQILDLRRGFQAIPFSIQPVLLAGSLALLAVVLRLAARGGPAAIRLLVLLALLPTLLGGLSLVHHLAARRLAERWAGGSEERLAASIRTIRAEFSGFLARIVAPAEGLRGSTAPEDRNSAFRLAADLQSRSRPGVRQGWCVWEGADLRAWAGRAGGFSPPETSTGSYAVIRRGAAVILVAGVPLEGSGRLTTEYLLQSPLEAEPVLPIPALQRELGLGRASVDLLLPGEVAEAGGPSAWDPPDAVRRGSPLAGRPTRHFSLSSPDEDPLAEVTLRDDLPEEAVAARTRREAAAGWLLVAGVCGAGGVLLLRSTRRDRRPSHAPRWLALLGGSGLLVACRAALIPPRPALAPHRFFSPEVFACDLAGDLFRSPGDLFLTAVVFCLVMAAWHAAIRTEESPARRRLAGAVSLLLLALLGSALLRAAAEFPRDASFDLLRISFRDPDPAAIAVQASLFTLFASWLYAAGGAALALLPAPAARWRDRAGRLPGIVRLAGFSGLGVLLLYPVVERGTASVRRTFFRSEILPWVEHQDTRRQDELEQVLAQLRKSPALRRKLDERHAPDDPGLAYRIWAGTQLREDGLISSLHLYEDGESAGSFGFGLPTRPDAPPPPPGPDAPIRRATVPVGGLRIPVLVGSARVAGGSAGQVEVAVRLLDRYDNLRVIRREDPFARLFQGSPVVRRSPELLGTEPFVGLYDTAGRPVYSNREGGAALPAALAASLEPDRIRRAVLSSRAGTRDEVFLRRGETRIVAAGFRIPSALERVGGFVRLTLVGMLVTLLGLAALRAAGIAPPDPAGRVRGRFYRRLLLAFLAASLVPLLFVALIFDRFAIVEARQDVVTEGIGALEAARRIVEDYRRELAETPLADEVVTYLAEVVRQDLSIFLDGDLRATSTRGLYDSGLLPPRLDGDLYRQLDLRGEPFGFHRQDLGDLQYRGIAAPLDLGPDSEGILYVPLARKEREIHRKLAEAEEAILIVTAVMLVGLPAVAQHLARRISDPVAELARATGRIAAGDYETRVQAPGRDETAMLIEAFNRMAASLKDQREDLRRRRDYIEKILLNATTGVISTDADGRVVTINPAARLLLRLDRPEPEGILLDDLVAARGDLAPLREALARSAPGRERAWQVAIPGSAGPRTLRIVSLPFREAPEKSPGRILLLEDLTETVRSSRLEAWAEMARRIAHEIKNPLTPIQLSVGHLRKVRRSEDPRFDRVLEDCLDTIENQVRSLRGIAAEFSDYARLPRLRTEAIRAEEVLEEALAPYRAAPPPGIRLEAQVEPETPPLVADRALLARALANLIQNALEAMPDGGTLSLRARRDSRGEVAGGNGVALEVRDTGAGMDSETLSRLFEPYFSTKSRGTGLGLSIVRKTVEEQGGRVAVRSEPGRGTEITLVLPAAGEPPAAERASREPAV